jgi:hypothetical protein
MVSVFFQQKIQLKIWENLESFVFWVEFDCFFLFFEKFSNFLNHKIEKQNPQLMVP